MQFVHSVLLKYVYTSIEFPVGLKTRLIHVCTNNCEGYCSWVCVSVCLSVCLLSHISPMERLFVLKTLSRTQRATKVKTFVGFSLKPLRCRDPALPPLCGRAYSRPFFLRKARMRMGLAPPSVFPSWRIIISLPPLAFATSSGCASPVYLLMLAVCEKLALLTGIHRPWARVPAT